jgi:hypothetical protein
VTGRHRWTDPSNYYRDISTHVAACAAKGLGTDDLAKIDLRELKA